MRVPVVVDSVGGFQRSENEVQHLFTDLLKWRIVDARFDHANLGQYGSQRTDEVP
ncbi:hypothetical protein SDC9_110890 [bioreactor metagenome]|uniref:Uncharacterized protein n=1 Tax=bioreactor metagenome TaxID=1076179 RepID=A0A645BEX4_9ZZZZ